MNNFKFTQYVHSLDIFNLQSKTIAEQTAEKINAKLGYRPPSEDEDGENSNAETFKRYEEELEINDFPQTARWKVTSKVNIHLSNPHLCNPLLLQ